MTKNKEEIEFFLKEIGKRVAYYRKIKNVSQLELANALNYKSVSSIANSEVFYKKTSFNLKQLYEISKYLEVPISKFLPEI